MRNLIDVLRDMRSKVPEDKSTFLFDLDKLISTVSYSAPELQRNNWFMVSDLLESTFTAPNELELWQQEVVDIFMNKTPNPSSLSQQEKKI